jgi:hypothetical protein
MAGFCFSILFRKIFQNCILDSFMRNYLQKPLLAVDFGWGRHHPWLPPSPFFY